MARKTVVDLFSGCGGASLGFVRTGFEIVGAVDNDESANETFEHNLAIAPAKLDLSKSNVKKLLYAKKEWVSPDVLVGCPPCQGFSTLYRHPIDKRNQLVLRFSKLVREMGPQVVVFENVEGILKVKGGWYTNKLKQRLRSSGYSVSSGVIDAVDYGVPQFRRRYLLLAVRDLAEGPSLPPPTHTHPKRAEERGLNPWPTVRDAIGDLPPLKAGERAESPPQHQAPLHSPRIMRMISKIPKDGGFREDLPKKYWLDCHRRNRGFYDVYGRAYWDRPSNTLTSGCTNASKGRFIHPEQNRAFTIREAARIQTFPDEYIFCGSKVSASRQIGNSVPPRLAEKIAEHIKNFI